MHMSQRIAIVGGVAAGASAATKARRTNEQAEIVILEAGPYVSFANCGLPYLVGGEIPNRQSLLVVRPELLRQRFNLDLRTGCRVVALDRQRRTLTVSMPEGKSEDLPYDRLILGHRDRRGDSAR
jgi:NADPH-dependent 2,4-dienoyl-CoA reductase/sulfur reductase-like enzyme